MNLRKTICVAILGLLVTTIGMPVEAKTKIQLWYGLKGYLGKQVEKVCERFNAAQSDYEIVCTGKGNYDQALQAGIAAYRAKKHPHILQGVDSATATMLLSGAVYPAYQLMADTGYKVDWDDYFGSIMNYYASSDGKLYSFPFNSSTPVMYYNIDMYEKAGIKAPAETWEQFEADLRKMKAAGIACPTAFATFLWVHLEQYSFIHGEPIATRNNGYDGLDAQLVFNKTSFVHHVERLKRWYDDKLGVYGKELAGIGTRESFINGVCGHFFGSIASHGTVLKTAKMKWGVAMLPHNKGVKPNNTVVGGASFWVLKGFDAAEYKGVAAFFEFLRSEKSQEFWSTVTGFVPTTKSSYEALVAEGFYKKPEYAGREIAIKSLTRTPPTPLS
ncbi:MAG: extracellular solute-binding protein, partial [Proteobacteria bacterium]|nr:extracellular solute-binding protein [Pseudomonadota bacterium]